MKVTILCVKPRKFKLLSWLILKFTKAGYSHVAIAMKDSWLGIRKSYDSVAPYTRMLAMENFKSQYLIIKAYVIDLPEDKAKHIERRAVLALGTQYSYIGVWHQFLRIIKLKRGKFQDGLSTLYCLEFAMWLTDEDSLADAENMNLDEFDKWIAERARPVSQAIIERINNARILEVAQA